MKQPYVKLKLSVKLLLLCLCLLSGHQSALAYDAEINGIYYNLNNDDLTATVTYKYNSTSSYSGYVTIPSSVTHNGSTYNVTSIGDNAFYRGGITSVTIPESVTSIGNSAFKKCINLKSVTIPKNVTSISSETFSGCSSLQSVTIPNGVTSIGNYAFYDCRFFSVTIPESVTSIDPDAFNHCINLTSIIIPYGVTVLNTGAFRDCFSLTSVTIPNGVTSIGDYAFSYCEKLSSIAIPESVKTIGDQAFFYNNSLTSITIPNSVTSIGPEAFCGCSILESVTIGESVTSIGLGAFHDCSNLTSVIIPKSVTSISRNTFASCRSLTSVTIPESVTSIGGGAFAGCSSLTSVTIPNSVTHIDTGAFSGCSSLTSVTIPNSVLIIGGSAFSGCSGLTSIVVEEDNVNYDSRVDCNAIIEKYNNCLIVGCRNTIIPRSVTSIGSYAFSGCSGLTSITIPESVTGIYEYAFEDCSGLTSVYCLAETPPSVYYSSSFNTYSSTTLCVPASALGAYKADATWGQFETIKGILNVGSTGYATFSCTEALDFTNVENIYAYQAKVDNGSVSYRRIRKVPANTGLLLRNPEGEAVEGYEGLVPLLADDEEAESTEGNAFVAVNEEIASLSTDGGGSSVNYILYNGTNGIGFYLANGQKVGAGKAYLTLPSGVHVKAFTFDDDDATGISLTPALSEGEGAIYKQGSTMVNLAGQRVAENYKGVVIINGKKVLKN